MGSIRRAAATASRSIDGRTYVLSLDDRQVHALNDTAAVIWESIGEGRSIDDLVRAVREVFEVDENEARADVEAFVADLAKLGLIEDNRKSEGGAA